MIDDIYNVLKYAYPIIDEKYLLITEGDENKGIPSLFRYISDELCGKTSLTENEAWIHVITAMDYYIADYPEPCAYKQKLWDLFVVWLQNLAFDIHIPFNIEEVEKVMPRPVEYDLVTELIKDLHYSKAGISKEELAAKYNIGSRTIKNTINKFNRKKKGIIRIAGQKVDFGIVERYIYDESNRITKRYFSATSTVNPIFLQFNIAQIHSLINGLKCSYYDEERNMSITSAAEIWSQLSDYTKDRIKLVYSDDDRLTDFLEIVEDELNSFNLHSHQSEREQVKEEDLSEFEIVEIDRKMNT